MADKKTYKPFDELLDKSGLRYSIIAERAEVPYDTFYKWRVNPRSMTGIGMGMLAGVLGCDIEELYDVTKKFKEELDKMESSELVS